MTDEQRWEIYLGVAGAILIGGMFYTAWKRKRTKSGDLGEDNCNCVALAVAWPLALTLFALYVFFHIPSWLVQGFRAPTGPVSTPPPAARKKAKSLTCDYCGSPRTAFSQGCVNCGAGGGTGIDTNAATPSAPPQPSRLSQHRARAVEYHHYHDCERPSEHNNYGDDYMSVPDNGYW